jgi:stage IV sporulation protein FB
MPTRAHFSLFGIPIRVEPVFLIIALLFGLQYAEYDTKLVFAWVAVTFVSILVHELGHGLTLKSFGQRSSIVLHGFGGVTMHRGRLSKGQSIAVSVAGSVTCLALLWWPARQLRASDWFLDQSFVVQNTVIFVAFANLWWSVANLLPIRPLDGGNVVQELFGVDASRKASIVVAGVAGIWAFTQDQRLAGFFALYLAYSNYVELKAANEGRPANSFEVDGPPPPP